ncbi:MAG: hypothetical protein FJ316_02490 [SAR202 cluster bacterium]|nr:hypothetical protein [SAR202 cluster bacterium]
MEEIKAKLKRELAGLYQEGVAIFFDEDKNQQSTKGRKTKRSTAEPETQHVPIHMRYQSWYSKALPVVRQLLPERYTEFQEQYKLDKRKEKQIDFLTYTVSDYLLGITVTRGYQKEEVVHPFTAFAAKFQNQLTILHSASDRIDSLLAEVESVLQSEMFRNELEAADDLLKKKHLRAAGALAGVALETHLVRVSINHSIKLAKKSPTISDINEALKTASVIDVPVWRHIQLLGDVRNLCVHGKEREPTYDEVVGLISGTKQIISTIF